MITASTIRKMAITALGSGGFHPTDMPTLVEWDIAGRCEAPVTRILHGRDETKEMTKFLVNPGSMSLILHAPCRKCPTCLRVRAALWRQRATVEINRATRTWFATFTMTPEEHHLSWMRISKVQRLKNGGELPPLNAFEAIKLRNKDFGRLLTAYFKRLRKQTGTSLRYILVAEAHKSGLPHFHALIHERGEPVRKTALQNQWPHGFTTFKLVDTGNSRAAHYVCKYISKSALTRVRASQRYGKTMTP